MKSLIALLLGVSLYFIIGCKAQVDQSLTDYVMIDGGTERAWTSKLNYEKRKGWYVSIKTGDTLFRSDSKYESYSGWPSFTWGYMDKLELFADPNNTGLEVRERNTPYHLGHRFNDGPVGEGYRYCINGAALRFLPDDSIYHRKVSIK